MLAYIVYLLTILAGTATDSHADQARAAASCLVAYSTITRPVAEGECGCEGECSCGAGCSCRAGGECDSTSPEGEAEVQVEETVEQLAVPGAGRGATCPNGKCSYRR